MSPAELTAALKEEARRLGFDLAGTTPAIRPPTLDVFRRWLADGCAGSMQYLSDRAAAYEHPRHVLEGVQSILMLAVNYRTVEPAAAGPGQGSLSRYAWGSDYHELIRPRLHQLADFHRRLSPGAAVRGVVDTAPLLEREFARLAGLGSIGKNTLLVNRRFGSWLVLAALLSSEQLEYDAPADADLCGACRACLDACPTGALGEPYRVDARKCISYLTIQSRADTPAGLQGAIGRRVLGCDACQEACPWNRATPPTAGPGFQPRAGMNPLNLADLLDMDDAAFRQRFRGSIAGRVGRQGMCRNAGA
ncbi:MAG: tRNA epoxyqueuosine(34) reductase QueG [Thermoguttaceae bacterium]|jgi:epoxyqueuosine reductase